jgi:hypothetical protein
MWSQGCALFTKMSASGRNALGSSRLPTRRPTMSGRAETRMNSGQPHSGQNARVTKRVDALYAPDNRGLWLKIKCLNREEFVVIGWTDPEGHARGSARCCSPITTRIIA